MPPVEGDTSSDSGGTQYMGTASAPVPITPASVADQSLDDYMAQFKTTIGNVIGASKIYNGALNSAMGSVADAGLQAAGAVDQTKTAVVAKSQAEIDASGMELAAADKKKNDDLTVATANGMTTQQMVDRANRINIIAGKIRADNDDISSTAGATFFNDPGQYLSNAFTMPGKFKQRAADMESLKSERDILDLQDAATADGAKVNAAVDAVGGAAYTQAKATEISEQAKELLANATMEGARFASSNATTLASLTEASMNNNVHVASVIGSAVNEARANVSLDATLGSKSIRSQRIQMGMDQLKALDKNNLLASVAAGRGDNPVSNAEVNGSFSTNQKSAWEMLSNSVAQGVTLGQSPAEAAKGPTPVDAAFVVDSLGIKLPNATMVDTKNWIKGTAAETEGAQTRVGQVPFHSLSAADKTFTVNKAIENKYDNLYSNIPASGSPLSPGTLSSILAIPVVGQTDLARLVAPTATSRTTAINYDVLGQQAENMVHSGKSIPEVAAQMQKFGQGMTAQVNSIRGLSQFALPELGTDQRPSFNVNMRDAQGNIKSVDLNNKAALETYLTRRVMQTNFVAENGSGPRGAGLHQPQ